MRVPTIVDITYKRSSFVKKKILSYLFLIDLIMALSTEKNAQHKSWELGFIQGTTEDYSTGRKPLR